MEIDRIKHLAGLDVLNEGANEYSDSAEFTEDLDKVVDAAKALNSIVTSAKWSKWLLATDENYDTICGAIMKDILPAVKALYPAVIGLAKEIDRADGA